MSGVVRVAASGGRGATALPGDGGGRGATALPGWVCEGGVWRRETIHSMLRRLPGWDYTKPWIYQIFIALAATKEVA